MKYLVDAQLPRRLAREIAVLGGEAVHTLDLPDGNATPDDELLRFAAANHAVLVTKDSDFVDHFQMRRGPAKLLFVTTGNIANNDLLALFRLNWHRIENMLATGDFVEMTRHTLTLHG